MSHRGAVAVDPLLGNGAVGAGVSGVGGASLLCEDGEHLREEGGGTNERLVTGLDEQTSRPTPLCSAGGTRSM